jgi:hypothetical protein
MVKSALNQPIRVNATMSKIKMMNILIEAEEVEMLMANQASINLMIITSLLIKILYRIEVDPTLMLVTKIGQLKLRRITSKELSVATEMIEIKVNT